MGQQYVYGKNVVRQLLEEDKKIYEVILMDGFKDPKLMALLKGKNFPIKTIVDKALKVLFIMIENQERNEVIP